MMSKVYVIIDCSIPINTRNQKILDSLKKHDRDCTIHVITWNRECATLPNLSNYHVYNYLAPLANPFTKLKGMIGFRRFIKDALNQISPDVIIASHWSNLILTYRYKRADQILVYENLDVPTGGYIIRLVSSILEKLALKKVNIIVFASRFFKELYSDKIPGIVLENKPRFSINYKDIEMSESPVRISFIGSIRYKEILNNLVDAVRTDSRVQLAFYGDGEDLDYMVNKCSDIDNIYFTGRYDYSMIGELYYKSDVIWAAYPNKDFNVIYAISNKFHESLYMGVPCIFSNGTKLSNLVREKNLGLIVDPYSVLSIRKLIDDICSRKVDLLAIQKSMMDFQNNETSWDEDFLKLMSLIN